MNDIEWWVWLLVALAAVLIVVGLVVAVRKAGTERRMKQQRAKATELRDEAKESQVEAQQMQAAAASAKADAEEARLEAERLDREAARASQSAAERAGEADRVDPDVRDGDPSPGDAEVGRDRARGDDGTLDR